MGLVDDVEDEEGEGSEERARDWRATLKSKL